MKPCKPDYNKASHVKKMQEIMQSSDYVLEEKIDGIRGLCIGGRFFSTKISKKTGLPSEKTDHIAHLAVPLRKCSEMMILDGEIYYPYKKSNHVTSITNCEPAEAVSRQVNKFLHNEGDNLTLPPFVANRRSETYEPGYLRFVAYDILRDVDGTWLVTKPFEERRKILEQRIAELSHIEHLDLNAVYHDRFQERLDEILARGGEGAILKHKKKSYYPGKRPMWNQIKLKQEMMDDVVIIGFEPPTKLYEGKNVEKWPYWKDGVPVTEHYYKGYIGSIRIGKYDAHGNLVDLGTVTGLTEDLRRDMSLHPDKYIGTVMQIKAMEISEHGVYRHANFYAWHPDKNAHECRLQEND